MNPNNSKQVRAESVRPASQLPAGLSDKDFQSEHQPLEQAQRHSIEELLVRSRVFARRLGTCVHTIARMERRGAIRGLHFNKRLIRYPASELTGWCKRRAYRKQYRRAAGKQHPPKRNQMPTHSLESSPASSPAASGLVSEIVALHGEIITATRTSLDKAIRIGAIRLTLRSVTSPMRMALFRLVRRAAVMISRWKATISNKPGCSWA